jgi:nucleoside-diphosphate-sugar epimerase
MIDGKNGESYNIADEKSDIRLKDLAQKIADFSKTKVIFELPDEVEKAGFSKATKSRLDYSKLKSLGWKAQYSIEDGIKNTLNILKL